MSILKTPGEQYPVNYFKTYVIGETVKIMDPPYKGMLGVIAEIRDGKDAHDPDKNPEIIVKLNPPIFDEEEENITNYFNHMYPSEAPWSMKHINLDRITVSIYAISSISEEIFEEYDVYAVGETFEGNAVPTIYFIDEESARAEVNKKVFNAGGADGCNLQIYRDLNCMTVTVNGHAISMTKETIKLSRDVERRIGWNHNDKVYMEDFMDRFDDMIDGITFFNELDYKIEVEKAMEADRGNIVDNINHSLGTNEPYWEAYWYTIDTVAEEWMENYVGSPSQADEDETGKE